MPMIPNDETPAVCMNAAAHDQAKAIALLKRCHVFLGFHANTVSSWELRDDVGFFLGVDDE